MPGRNRSLDLSVTRPDSLTSVPRRCQSAYLEKAASSWAATPAASAGQCISWNSGDHELGCSPVAMHSWQQARLHSSPCQAAAYHQIICVLLTFPRLPSSTNVRASYLPSVWSRAAGAAAITVGVAGKFIIDHYEWKFILLMRSQPFVQHS